MVLWHSSIVCFSPPRAHVGLSAWIRSLCAVFLAFFADEHLLDLLVAANRRALDAYTSSAKSDLVCRFRVFAKDPKVSVLFPALWVFYPGDIGDRTLLDVSRLFEVADTFIVGLEQDWDESRYYLVRTFQNFVRVSQ
jgi:hypothetical protein